MAKKRFSIPYVRLSGMNTGEGNVIGMGSGQSTPDIEPWDWELWAVMFDEDDSSGNGTPGEWADYVLWWQSNGFSAELFEELNGVPIDGPEP